MASKKKSKKTKKASKKARKKPTRKKTARKKAARKKPAKKRAPARKRASSAAYLAKLDPTLHVGALRAPSAPSAEPLDTVRSLDLGAETLRARMTPSAAAAFGTNELVPVVIDCARTETVRDELHGAGGTCSRVAGTTLLAKIPRSKLGEIARLKDVRYIEASAKLRLHLDQAHLSSRLVRGTARTVPQTGEGVLVGVVDTGIDVLHPAFRKDGKTRLVSYLDQYNDELYDQARIDAGEADGVDDTIGHGTHVAGIAAGNGTGSPGGRLFGVAPEADLAVVKSTLGSADILAGIAQIFEIAETRGQPAVVNCSFGGHYGGHDGSSIIERTIDELSGPGRIVVVSAGNEGNDPIHARTVLRGDGATAAEWEAPFQIHPGTYPTGSGPRELGLILLQVWQQREDDLQIRLRAPGGQIVAPPEEGSEDQDFGSFFVSASRQIHPYSGDPFVTFQVVALPQPQWLGGWRLLVGEASPGSSRVGAVHAWIQDGSLGSFTTNASFDYLIGMPATAYSAVSVGSYTTRNEWSSRDPESPIVRLAGLELEALSSFSSIGPTRDGQNKPELAAPGEWIVAPLSSDASTAELPLFTRVDGIEYAALRGTSMSAPYVTGALALLLEKDPGIDWAEAKRRLIKSTRQDEHTGVCWNPRWGYGKLDVERLLTIEPSS